MANELSWIPETLKILLERSESHYRSINFKRTAHLMKQTYDDAVRGSVSVEFYAKYVRVLKDDSKDFFKSFGFDEATTDAFIASMNRSIDAVQLMLNTLDKEGKTPTFNGATSKNEDVEAINAYLDENGGLFDPIESTPDHYSALEAMDPFYEVVYNHVFIPGRDFIVSQVDLAIGHDHMLEYADSILSVDGLIPDCKLNVADFRYAFQHPGNFNEDETGWVLTDKVTVPVKAIARWPLFMYYKVPIITAMLPIHNVIFFSLVQETMAKRKQN